MRKSVGYAVDAYVDGVQTKQVDQLRRMAWADVASQKDRFRAAVLQDAREKAQAEGDASAHAVDTARAATQDVQHLRAELEQTIAERESSDAGSDAARRAATPPQAPWQKRNPPKSQGSPH